MTNMIPAGYGSAAGAIEELHRIGAVEGVHYRLSNPGEDINDFVVALDNGPMILTYTSGVTLAATPDSPARFAVLNADGMQLVGGGMTAVQMRKGKMPAEAAYILTVEP